MLADIEAECVRRGSERIDSDSDDGLYRDMPPGVKPWRPVLSQPLPNSRLHFDLAVC